MVTRERSLFVYLTKSDMGGERPIGKCTVEFVLGVMCLCDVPVQSISLSLNDMEHSSEWLMSEPT